MAGRAATIALFLAVEAFCFAFSETILVETSQGPIKGYKDETTAGRGFYAFTGIPYGTPPVGELRFKDPQPAGPWSGTLDATGVKPACAQIPFSILGDIQFMGEEDCLTLNVYTPNLGDSSLPVMVYFHGGGYFMGGAHDSTPHDLLEEDIVMVSVQYRLAALGFLSTGDDHAPGNLGLKDQNLSLKWVQKNIGAFGGDPSRVTIFGESAGASSVHFHMFIEESRGLFQQAILQSGVVTCPWAFYDKPREVAIAIAQNFDCPTSSSEKLVQCLQQVPLKEITSTHLQFFKFGIYPNVMGPFVDGKFITDEPMRLLKQGKYADVNIMIGSTKDEGAIDTSLFYSDESILRGVEDNFSENAPILLGILDSVDDSKLLTTLVFEHYFGEDRKLVESGSQFLEMMSDRVFLIPIDNIALAHIQNKGLDSDVFMYEFDYKGKHSLIDAFPRHLMADNSIAKTWVSHADDVQYLFPGCAYFPAKQDNDGYKKMAQMMVKLWTNFATYGNPTPDDSLGFQWEPAEEKNFRRLSIDLNSSMKDYQREKNRQFWNSLPLPENIVAFPDQFPNHKVETFKKVSPNEEL